MSLRASVLAYACSATALALSAAIPSARAQGAVARLDYAEASGCPSRDAFVERVEARLGRPPFDEAASPVVEVRIEGGRMLRGSMRWLDVGDAVEGARTLSGPSCDELAESLAVVVAMVLEDPPRPPDDPDAPPVSEVASEPGVEPPPAVERAPSVDSVRAVDSVPPPAASAPSESTSPPLELEMGGALHAGLGWTPDVSLGVGARVGLRWGLLSVHLGSVVDVGPSTRLASGDSVDAFHATLGAGVCIRPGVLAVCLEGGGGAFQATVHSVAQPSARTSPTASIAVRAAGHFVPIEGFAIEPFVAASVLVLRPALDVAEVRVWEAPIVAGRLGVELLGIVR